MSGQVWGILYCKSRVVCPPANEQRNIKGQVHCYSIQVVMNKYFLLNPEKNLAQICLFVFKKNTKNAHFNSENDDIEPKARLL